jgi:hypothetical protein
MMAIRRVGNPVAQVGDLVGTFGRRYAFAGLALGGLLATAGIVAPSHAAPAAASVSDQEKLPLATIRHFDPAEFTVAAKAIPRGVVNALADNPGITGAEYLARSEAAIDAVAVVESLDASGIDVLSSRLDGTELIVNVSTAADAKVVTLTGATAEVGPAATEPIDTGGAEFVDRDLYGGSAYYFQNAQYGARCSVGFNGHIVSSGAEQFATAGHCILPKLALGGYYHRLDQYAASTDEDDYYYDAERVGKPVVSSFKLGSGYDTGLVTVTSSAWNAKPAVLSWNLSQNGAPNTAQTITDGIPAVVGAPICKSGATTGWTCGTVTRVDEQISVQGTVVNSIVANICVLSGDSGGAGLIGGAAVGTTSWSTRGITQGCSTSPNLNTAGFFPLYSSNPARASVTKLHGSKWELAVAVQTPAIAVPYGHLAYGANLSGSFPGGTTRHRVTVLVDGTTTLSGLVQADGTWTANLRALAPGIHTATVTGRWGAWSKSGASAPVTFTVDAPALLAVAASPTASRESVDASRMAFPETAPVVYLSTGSTQVDLLGAISAGAVDGGPVLLIKRDFIPGAVADEIRRLAPSRIVLAGGAGVVTDEVLAQLAALGPLVGQESAEQLTTKAFASAPVPLAVDAQLTSLSSPAVAKPAAVVGLGPVEGWRAAYESTAWARR